MGNIAPVATSYTCRDAEQRSDDGGEVAERHLDAADHIGALSDGAENRAPIELRTGVGQPTGNGQACGIGQRPLRPLRYLASITQKSS